MESSQKQDGQIRLAQSEMEADLKHFLLEKYGPLISSERLWQILEFRSKDAFERSFQRGRLDLPLFRPPGREGLFVLTPHLATHLVKVADASQIVDRSDSR